MAESHSIEAVLSARDQGFSAGFKNAGGLIERFSSKMKSGLSMGVFMAIGQKAVGAVTSGISGMIGEMNQSSAAWKTFEGNMKNFGKSSEYIAEVKDELQEFAQKTIYSSSDMANTFAQLEAVGTKNTAKLVKGFGGLAAAAENPTQAMKTLSTQATQMAAKPKVAWMDFKLMLEQSPAGMAAVAEQMGKSLEQMISDIQDGKISTDEFFEAVDRAGNSEGMQKMATQYKNVSQAMDGLKETAANKLMPVFGQLEGVAIRAIEGITDKIGEIDFQKVADNISDFMAKVKPYWDVIAEAASKVWGAFSEAISAVAGEVAALNGEFGSTESVENFKGVVDQVADAFVALAGFIKDHKAEIAQLIKHLPKIAAGFIALKVVGRVAPFVSAFAGGIKRIASAGLSRIAGKLPEVAAGQSSVGDASASSGSSILKAGLAFLAFGAGVLLAAGGLWIIAQAAVQLASAGWPAIAVMFGLVAAMAALAWGASAIGPALSAGASGFIAFGAGVVLVGAGLWILSQAAIQLAAAGWPAIACLAALALVLAGLIIVVAVFGPMLSAGAVGFLMFGAALILVGVAALLGALALQMIVSVLPAICEYGLRGAVAILALGGALLVFGLGAAVAGIGIAVLAVGLLLLAAALLLAGVAAVVLGAGLLLMGAGAMLGAVALTLIAAVLPAIAANGLQASLAILALGASMLIFGAGAVVAGLGAVVFGAGLLILAVGLLAVGAAGLLASIGLLGVAVAIVLIATAGMTAAVAIMAISAGLLLLSGAALLCAAGTVALTGGVALLALGLAGLAAAALAGALAAAGLLVALLGVQASLGAIRNDADQAALKIVAMLVAVDVIKAGMSALGSLVGNVLNRIIGLFDDTAQKTQASAQAIGNGVNTALNTTLNTAYSQAQARTQSATQQIADALRQLIGKVTEIGRTAGSSFMEALNTAYQQALRISRNTASRIPDILRSAQSPAYDAGQMIGQGLANGMRSMLSTVWSIAAELASAADAAIRAKARIHSPARTQIENGEYWGEGFAIGIAKSSGLVELQSQALIDAANPGRMNAGSSMPVIDNAAAQPLQLILEMGGREWSLFVDDITDTSKRKMQLELVGAM